MSQYQLKINLSADGTALVSALASADAAIKNLGGGAQALKLQLDGSTQASARLYASLTQIAKASALFAGVNAALAGVVSVLTALPGSGIAYAKSLETARLGIAGVLASMTEVDGKATSFEQAMGISGLIVKALAADAARTAASTEELVGAFQALVGPGLAAGGSLEQIQKLATTGVAATKALGLQSNQVIQELRDLVQGGITPASSTLATALGLKDADITKAKASGEGLFVFLEKRMAGFAKASEAYGSTLGGAVSQLQEAAARRSDEVFAPLTQALTEQAKQIGEALSGDQSSKELNSIGALAASVATGLGQAAQFAIRYADAILALGIAIGSIKLGAFVSDVVRAGAAKAAAAQLAATQAAAEAAANGAVAQSTVSKIAAYRAEIAAALDVAKARQGLIQMQLAQAQASAASASGIARLAIVEREVVPLQRQLVEQTQAVAAAQNAKAAASSAAATALRGMGSVVGALGGPIGIAITALTALAGWLITARSEADKLGKVNLSRLRVEAGIKAGQAPDAMDLSRIQSRLQELKEEADGVEVKLQEFPFSVPLDTQKRALQRQISDLEDLQRRAQAAGQSGGASGAGLAGTIGLNASTSRKQLDELFASVKTASTLADQAREKLAALDKAFADERARMVARKAPQTEIDAEEKRVTETRRKIQADLEKALADEQRERGAQAAALRDAEIKADKVAREAQAALAADANARALAELQRRLEAETLSLEGFYAEKLRLARADADAQIRLREQDLAALARTPPKDEADAQQQRAERSKLQAELTKLRRDRAQLPADTERERRADELKLAEQAVRERLGIEQRGIDAELALRTQARAAGELDAAGLAAAAEQAALRRVQAEAAAADAILAERRRLGAPAAEVRAAEADVGAARGRVTEQRSGTLAEAGEQLRRLREQARDIRLNLVADPQQRDLQETEARIKRLREEAGSITARLNVQLDAKDTTKTQRSAIEAQLRELASATADAVAAENEALAERMKPGWRRLVDGWRDTQRLMREATDNAMQGLLSSAEDAFVRFAQTGKLSVKGMVDTIIAELARVQFRQAVASSGGQGLLGLIASFLPGAGGGSAGAGSSGVDYSLPTAGVKLGRAGGGLITGPGTGTSDEVPAMLSNGEFVIRAAAVQRLGLGLLERLNQADRVPAGVRRSLPAFAEGGLVGRSAAASWRSDSSPMQVIVNNNAGQVAQASAREGRGPDGSRIVEVLIEQVEATLAGKISRGTGPVAGALQRTYGLNRAAGAY